MENPFTDVPENKWYSQPVLWALEKGITSGTSATEFSPDETCTRAQVVTFLWRAKGSPEPESDDNPFTDVKEGKYYYKAVLWAVEQGITGGTSANTFSPNQPCTRAQVATFLYAAAGRPDVDGVNVFADVSDSDWYTIPVIWARDHEVTSGIGGGKFGPEQICTRGQIVTFLYAAVSKPNVDISAMLSGVSELLSQENLQNGGNG